LEIHIMNPSKTRLRRNVLATLGALACASLWALPVQAAEQAKPASTTAGKKAYAVDRNLNVAIPKLKLVKSDGKKIDLREELASDGPLIMNFVFISCSSICPIMSATFSAVHTRLGERAQGMRMISISIDPEYDTPAKLAEYAAGLNASKDWYFLTGTSAAVRKVQEAFGVYRGDKMNHTPIVLLRKDKHSPWVKIEGLVAPDDIIAELGTILAAR
jgi:protein SCO1